MPWVKGQSGNPAGRKPKQRALTEILARAGSMSMEVDGKRISGRRLMARHLWEIANTGRTTLADGREIIAGPQAWLDVVKFLYAQVDGPPPKELNVGGQPDNPLLVVNWDAATDSDADGSD